MTNKAKYIPYPFYWDDAPIDISFVFENEKPAGKHGFLTSIDDKFVFEDGTQVKFWGTNFNAAANFPCHEYSEKVAKRLAKFGVNIVRFHQLDAEWSTPNIFQYSKGRNKKDTLDFDPESMDKLDYLIYCLKKQGIYVYLDLLTYREFKSGDGVDAFEELPIAAKPINYFDRRLIELQKRYNFNLWTHFNPYTGLAYKDDPVFVLTEIVNEATLFYNNKNAVNIEPYKSRLTELYNSWEKDKEFEASKESKGNNQSKGINQSKEKESIDFNIYNEKMALFLIYIQKKYYTEMIEHMRTLGVKIPITGTNHTISAAQLSSQLTTDFTDSHSYWYTWSWRGDCKKMGNDSMTASMINMVPELSLFRVLDKPFFVSEWDQPWPNEWRSESPIFLAAVGAFQGWSGYCIHTYRYGTLENSDMIGKPVTSDALGGVYHRGGIFDSFNDPAKFGLFYHAALITRRNDVRQAEKTVELIVNDITTHFNIGKQAYPEKLPAIVALSEVHKTGIKLPNEKSCSDIQFPIEKEYIRFDEGEVSSDTGELYRSWDKKLGIIDTSMTKAAYGFLGEYGHINIEGLKIKVKNDFATIALSSLTPNPINNSDNLLLTTIGRADNSSSKYNEDHTIQEDPGHGPVMIEVIEAEIEITTKVRNLKVWAVNPQGFYIGSIPTIYDNDSFKFTIGEEFASIYYLIQAP